MDRPAPSLPQSSRAAMARFALAAAVLVAAQFAVSYALRRHLFFNDDLEHVAYGRFFSSVYERQYNVHMPLGALLSFLWGHAFGFTPEANRMLAATFNAGILVTLLHLGRRYFSLAAGLVAGVAWLLLESLLWAYMHLTEVPSVLLALLGTTVVLRLESSPALQGAGRAKLAFGAGLLFGLAAMARILVVEIFLLLVLLVVIWRVRRREPGTPWLGRLARDALWVTLGLGLPFLAFLGLFAALGTADDFIYWTVLHNMKVKKAGLELKAWIGFLHLRHIRNLWRFALTALLVSILGYVLHWRRQQGPVRAASGCVWAGAIGGWLGANPSGIGELALHAIPAFPFLGLAAGAGTVGVFRWASMRRGFVAWTVVVLVATGVGLTLKRPLLVTWDLVKQAPVAAEYARTALVGRYIREHSRPEDTLFVFGTNPLLYALSERNSPTPFSIVFMDVVPYEEALLTQLQRTPPRFVVLDPADFWFTHNLRELPRVRDYLLENYRVSAAFPELLEPRNPENEQRLVRYPD